MTSEQLFATRATLWRQKAEPLITLDDAQSWLSQIGLCLFLPRKAQIPAPASSFVEACLGETNPTPPRTAIETAKNLLVRLIDANAALPLNLLGTPSDHPDFLVSTEALPFVYALRGDRDWKHAPGTAGANRVSPLITHVWQLLERRGVLTAGEIQEELGKELTEAAVLRALNELWASLRVIPLYQASGQETLWEPLQSRHQKAITSGVGMSQVTALSVLASVYLQSVVAAGGDDAESFLSPLASRAKVREVIRGLSATRQLSMIQMETQSLLYVEGSLPEFPEAEKQMPSAKDEKPAIRKVHPTSPEGMQAALKRSVARSTEETRPRPAYKRPASSTGEAGTTRSPTRSGSFRPAAAGRSDSRERNPGSFRSAAGGTRPPFKSGLKSAFKSSFKPKSAPVGSSEPGSGLRADGTPKKTRWRDLPGGRPDQKGKPARFGPRKIDAGAETSSGGGTSRPAARREPGSFRPAAAGSMPPFKRTSAPRDGKPFRPSARPTGAVPSRGARPSYGGTNARTGRDSPRPGTGARPPFRPSSDRPAASGSRPTFGSRPASGSKPPTRSASGRFSARAEGSRPYKPSGRPPREDASGGERKFTPRPPRAGGFSSSRPAKAGGFSSSRPRTGDARPYSPRPAGRPTNGAKSGERSGGSSFKPAGRSTGGPPRPGSRPGFGPASRGPASRGTGSGGQSSRGPGFKPGGSRFSPGAGGPRPASGPKPARPSTIKKRPKSDE